MVIVKAEVKSPETIELKLTIEMTVIEWKTVYTDLEEAKTRNVFGPSGKLYREIFKAVDQLYKIVKKESDDFSEEKLNHE